MEKQAHRRHDISDEVWELLKPHLSGQVGQWGRVAKDNRNFINAVFWILRTIDASHIKVHPHASGAKGGNQEMSRTKGG
jgi:transposase